jgi:hypothetical protein
MSKTHWPGAKAQQRQKVSKIHEAFRFAPFGCGQRLTFVLHV